jgi:hypothetical protein
MNTDVFRHFEFGPGRELPDSDRPNKNLRSSVDFIAVASLCH